MAIIGPLPNIILDGQIIDAVPVMNDFNWIVNQVNANIPPLIPVVANSIIYVPAASVGGSANAITLTPTPAIGAYAEGQSFRFKAVATNTGAVTIATSGLAVRNVTMASGAALSGGEIMNGGEYDVCDTGSAYILVNSAQGTGLLTFTPTLLFGGGNTGMTLTTQLGQYWKMGPFVFFWIDCTVNPLGSSTGAATIGGLPFNVNASMASSFFPATFSWQSVSVSFAGGAFPSAILVPGTKTLQLRSGQANTNLSNFDFTAPCAFRCSGVYLS